MWTFRVAVVLGGRGVDANLRILQVIGSPEPSTGTEGLLDDRRTRGVAELREETSWRGAISVGARGGFGVNREIVGVFLKPSIGTEGWLDDRRTRGVAELREETSWRGAIFVGARGGFGVNREIVGGSSVF
ncbi:hypothetical protein Taro_055707 [Colocasia esculenta]|uniref:Uncharacterized protein n=1 Tax=Colocasia esculenta TaxID=4460 RepID=A0A843XUB5_COLES|nr:hypothetical protein [Colocasia esculenta]